MNEAEYRIWRVTKAEMDNALRDQFNSSYPTKAESLIALLVIQNNS